MMQKALLSGIRLIEGLKFADNDKFRSPTEVFKAFISHTSSDIPAELILIRFSALLITLLGKCNDYSDVYKRVRDKRAYFALVQSSWNSQHLLRVDDIEDVVLLVTKARSRYPRNPDPNIKPHESVIKPLDELIKSMDKVYETRVPRRPNNLNPPKIIHFPKSHKRMWPPRHFKPLDIAVLGEQTVRENMYGIDHRFTAEEEIKPEYPNDQSDPIAIRLYLSWLALTTQTATSRVSLFLVPVAFINHTQRQDWYQTTDFKSRYYATIDEFMAYAWNEIGNSEDDSKDHVLALATPWFFNFKEVESLAEYLTAKLNKPVSISTAWKQLCFRAGIVLCLSKSTWHRARGWSYRLLIFRPGLPTYPQAAEPTWRRNKQSVWIAETISQIQALFTLTDTLSGGCAKRHELPCPSRGVAADSVEASAEFITEIMEDVNCLPISEGEFADRCFASHAGIAQQLALTR
ncbi:hypothetical protein E0Z10_g10507 [Xylaria hypoxylon]|uniref:Uncharacterized protein n=1 Tax=Xylaria hypoxylon TaxID=37992 RepID=A0A4Z0YG51_9PEZI|nr:hypothetical protein E0Z10_g10507 [Xylaria hypoxylon]